MNDAPEERAPTSSEGGEIVDPAEKTQPAEGGREEAEDDETRSSGEADGD
jgi:hypothetical protein